MAASLEPTSTVSDPPAPGDFRPNMDDAPGPLALVLRSATSALAYAVPTAVSLALAGLGTFTLARRSALVIVNGAFQALETSDSFTAVLICAGVLVLLGHSFGITAATTAMNARVHGRKITLGGSWRAALQRWPAILLACAFSLLVLAGGLFIPYVVAAIMAAVSLPARIAAMMAVAILLIVLAPLLLAWPLIVRGGIAWGPAFARSWRAGDITFSIYAESIRSPRKALVIAAVVLGVIGACLTLLLRLMPASFMSVVVESAVWLIYFGAALLLPTAIAVRRVALRWPEPPEEAEGTTAVPGNGGSRRWAVAGFALLMVPALLLVPAVVVNPWNFTSYSEAKAPGLAPVAAIAAAGDNAVVRGDYERDALSACADSGCGATLHPDTSFAPSVGGLKDGSVLSAHWIPEEHADPASGTFRLEVIHAAPAQMDDWAAAQESERWGSGEPWHGTRATLASVEGKFAEYAPVRNEGNQSLTATAITTDGQHPVIAATAAPGHYGTHAQFSLFFCGDARCTTSTEQRIDVPWTGSYPKASTLDVAVTPSGTAVATLVERGRNNERLRVIMASPGTSPHIKELAALISRESQPGADDYHFGAQVEIGPGGLPVVLFRARETPALQLFQCEDVACAGFTSKDIEPESRSLHNPAFVVDGTGRPLIGFLDQARSTVELLSCHDAACSESSLHVIARNRPVKDRPTASGFAMALSADKRPLIVADGPFTTAGGSTDWQARVLQCTAARCGLP